MGVRGQEFQEAGNREIEPQEYIEAELACWSVGEDPTIDAQRKNLHPRAMCERNEAI